MIFWALFAFVNLLSLNISYVAANHSIYHLLPIKNHLTPHSFFIVHDELD